MMSQYIVCFEVRALQGGKPIQISTQIDIESSCDIKQRLVDDLAQHGCKLVEILTIRFEKRCFGCRYDRSGQSEHMEEGGCLHGPAE